MHAKPAFRPTAFSGLGFAPGALTRSEFRLPVVDRALVQQLREVTQEAPGCRAKIWELHQTFHCSIIGTCLTTGELKALVVKLAAASEDATSDHDLHKIAVTLAGTRGVGAKLLNKTLDRKFRRQIASFAAATDAAAVRRLWDAALAAGDIPGGYWAVMTHPATPEALVRHVFGEIHMLSHLVGAANRADIQRLRLLEAENAALLAKTERQQVALRDGLVARDRRIRELQDLLAAGAAATGSAALPAGHDDALAAVLAETRRRLERAERRALHLDDRVRALDQRAAASTARAAEADAALATLRETTEVLEAQLEAQLQAQLQALIAPAASGTAVGALDLGGMTILYVGGRLAQLPHLRGLVERLNGVLIHHSGGSDDSAASLPGCISRAQAVLFPVDCVSHAAMFEVKRACKQAGKPFLPLRTASLAALLKGLAELPAQISPDGGKQSH